MQFQLIAHRIAFQQVNGFNKFLRASTRLSVSDKAGLIESSIKSDIHQREDAHLPLQESAGVYSWRSVLEIGHATHEHKLHSRSRHKVGLLDSETPSLDYQS